MEGNKNWGGEGGLLRNTLTDSNPNNSQSSHDIILNQTLAIKTSGVCDGISTDTHRIRHVYAPSTRNYYKAQ